MSIMDDPVQLDTFQLDLKNKILIELAGGSSVKLSEAEDTELPSKTTLIDFFTRVKEVVDLTQGNADQRVLLTETMPESNLFQDPDKGSKELSGYILTTVLRREPGTLAGGNTPFSSKRQDVKPKIVRKIISKNPDNPGYSTIVFSQAFDNLVGFNICARTNKRANELAEWFESLMETNRFYFELNGFKPIFKGRMADLRRDDSLMKVSFRPFKYYVRTETYYTLTEKQLDRMVVQLTAKNS